MLEELQSKIETASGRLAALSDDIKQMKSIEDALGETDQSLAASANDLKSFVDAASRTHQSLIDAADAFKDAANRLETLDVVKLSETIKEGNDQIRAEVLRTEAKSHEELDRARQDLKTVEKRLTDSVVANGEATLKQIESSTAELNKATQQGLFPLKLFGGVTLVVAIVVLAIAVLILVNG